MRFHSTPESALNGEITKLAIIECIASVAIYLAIGFYFGTFRYLAMAVVVAPLMLLRTDASSDWWAGYYGEICGLHAPTKANGELISLPPRRGHSWSPVGNCAQNRRATVLDATKTALCSRRNACKLGAPSSVHGFLSPAPRFSRLRQ